MMFGRQKKIKTYWWKKKLNFGDLITPWLLDKKGVATIWSKPNNASLVGVGSILEHLPGNFKGAILGSGYISSTPKIKSFPRAKIVAVRGNLSADILEQEVSLHGDMGMLVSRYFNRKQDFCCRDISIIPNFIDKGLDSIRLLSDELGNNAKIICVQRGVDAVLKDICKSKLVISSSLHGVICAHSFGIPAIWLIASENVIGDGFKFRDYFSCFDLSMSPVSPEQILCASDLTELAGLPNLAERERITERLDLALESLI